MSVPEPRAARRLGVGMVFQHFSLFEAMTVAENVAPGLDDAPSDTRRLVQRIRAVSARSEERRVVKECVSTCRSRLSRYLLTHKYIYVYHCVPLINTPT